MRAYYHSRETPTQPIPKFNSVQKPHRKRTADFGFEKVQKLKNFFAKFLGQKNSPEKLEAKNGPKIGP
jgi:hypothetical protein